MLPRLVFGLIVAGGIGIALDGEPMLGATGVVIGVVIFVTWWREWRDEW